MHSNAADLGTWWSGSPYWVAGFYLAGLTATDQGCFEPSASWVSSVANIGWELMPIWDGRQSQCSGNVADLFSNDPNTALSQGNTAGQSAVSQAQTDGLPANSMLWLDVEGFTGTSTCLTAAKNYLQGFDFYVGFNGYQYGMYSSECNPDIDWAHTISTPPLAVWYANHNDLDDVSNFQCMTSSNWPLGKRAHQYVGNSTETYTGVTMKVDRDCVYAAVDSGHVYDPGC